MLRFSGNPRNLLLRHGVHGFGRKDVSETTEKMPLDDVGGELVNVGLESDLGKLVNLLT